MLCRYQQKRLDYAADYIRGELTGVEAEAFEAHYLTCEECFSAIRFVEKTTITINQFGASIFAPAPANSSPAFGSSGWLEKCKTWWNDFVFSTEWKTAVPAFATYALLVVALSIGYYWINSNPQFANHKPTSHTDRPSAMLPESQQIVDLARLQPLAWSISEDAQANATLLARLSEVKPLYENHNYFLAAERLAEIVKDFPESIEANLYLGISQLRLNQPVEAIESFHKVLELKSKHAAAQWYLAQGYLMQNNPDDAKKLLTALAEKQNSTYGQPALQLLTAIDKIQSQHK